MIWRWWLAVAPMIVARGDGFKLALRDRRRRQVQRTNPGPAGSGACQGSTESFFSLEARGRVPSRLRDPAWALSVATSVDVATRWPQDLQARASLRLAALERDSLLKVL